MAEIEYTGFRDVIFFEHAGSHLKCGATYMKEQDPEDLGLGILSSMILFPSEEARRHFFELEGARYELRAAERLRLHYEKRLKRILEAFPKIEAFLDYSERDEDDEE